VGGGLHTGTRKPVMRSGGQRQVDHRNDVHAAAAARGQSVSYYAFDESLFFLCEPPTS